MFVEGMSELEELLRNYDSGSKELSHEDYTGSEAENSLYDYLNLFKCISDGETYVLSTKKQKRHLKTPSCAYGYSINFSFRTRDLTLTDKFTTGSRKLSDFGKEVLLFWREHNNLDLQRGTKLEDIN
jgi:hypothetical protein